MNLRPEAVHGVGHGYVEMALYTALALAGDAGLPGPAPVVARAAVIAAGERIDTLSDPSRVPAHQQENAIRLMLKEDYSQLPVMKRDKVVGVISYESLAKTVFNFTESKSKPPSRVRVKDCIERVSRVFSVEDDLMNLLSALSDKPYVLIRKRSNITHIITSCDALWFFRTFGESSRSSNF